MAIVSKRADELKPGDMLAWNGMAGRVVVSVGKQAGDSVELITKGADSATAATFIGAASQVLVMSVDLTPAQQHADELLAFVEAAAASPARTALLDKIHPPVPPTEAEYLAAITAAHDGKDLTEVKQRLGALIARASRVAALKGK